MRAVLLAATLCACGPAAYAPRGVLAEHDVEAHSLRALGCLDVAFGARPKLYDDDAALLIVRFGNTCTEPVLLDLRAFAVHAIDREGVSWPLSYADPRGEIEPLHLDAAARGLEKIRLRGARDVAQICLTVQAAPVCVEVRP